MKLKVKAKIKIKGLLVRMCYCGRFMGIYASKCDRSFVSTGYCPECREIQAEKLRKYKLAI